jgi:NADPH-dependent ferric siderophore reductase
MASTKGRIVRLISGLALERATVKETRSIGGFQRLVMECKVPALKAGMKVQVLLPSDDMRTYTPIPCPDGMVLLGWKHVSGPGATWLSTAKLGDELPFVGPQRSLDLDPGPILLVGDETSVAVAAALSLERPGKVRAVIQSEDEVGVRNAAASVGLMDIVVVGRGDTLSTASAAATYLAEVPGATVALTGGSQLIVGVREQLRQRDGRALKTKTYWIPGRVGLD